MGLTYIQARIANPERPGRSARLKFLLDSGAHYSVVPTTVLRRLGIKPGRSKSFILADGTEIKRFMGEARFRINGEERTSPVIFGEEGDSTLLGIISLEVLGLILDPFKRELRSLPMSLAVRRPAWSRAGPGQKVATDSAFLSVGFPPRPNAHPTIGTP